MSVYNESIDWIDMAIESIINQTYTQIEFIIINDNPDNNEIIEYLKDKVNKDYRIKVFYNNQNKGLIASLNYAITQCSGEYIARMDADDISKEDRIEKQLNFLTKNNCDFVYSNVDLINEESEIVSIGKPILLKQTELKCISKYGNPSKHPTWFMKKSVYSELRGYRNIFFVEDYDFFLRALLNNYRIMQMDYNVLLYRYRENSISRKNALPQFKLTNLLKKLYKSGELLDNEKTINLYYKELNKINSKDSESYANCLISRDEGINKMKNKDYFRGISQVIKSSTINRFVLFNTINTINYRIKYKKIRGI
ncbi:hypothetical protein G314FT_20650 [Vagococcus luciliae]|uniref:Glycosyltransferase 2-like domain-containing protein n=2 Tax=Vagococcus luciliae TaxID=2920380 RepID=A0ABY5P2K3_9ENTE|nr:hypothetical protein G314FT_20650 [Vagococcus luciliae]